MKKVHGCSFYRFATALFLVVLASLFVLAGLAQGTYARAATHSQMTPSGVHANPLMQNVGSLAQGQQGTVLFGCQSNTPPTIKCYGPDQIRQAYGVTQLQNAGITGKGRSILIVDAFGSPTLAQDFATFNQAWGLPSGTLHIFTPFGVGGTNFGWAIETSLDVQWAHVWAPDATINLVVARTNDDADILNAVKYGIDNSLGDALSQSFGENESCMDPTIRTGFHDAYKKAVRKGITVLASAGDAGSAQATCDGTALVKAASYPASDPLVTAVGGTKLNADAVSGQYMSETAWNESAIFGAAATGGGFSQIFKRPDYQAGVVNRDQGRGLPDVSLNASIDGGVLVFITNPNNPAQTQVFVVGGTSVSCPELAGLLALGAQKIHHRLGFVNGGLYRLGKSGFNQVAFHDITTGDNILVGSGIAGFTTAKKWDAVTGWGTPKTARVFLDTLIGFVLIDDIKDL
jgi:subtilase family serine protease